MPIKRMTRRTRNCQNYGNLSSFFKGVVLAQCERYWGDCGVPPCQGIMARGFAKAVVAPHLISFNEGLYLFAALHMSGAKLCERHTPMLAEKLQLRLTRLNTLTMLERMEEIYLNRNLNTLSIFVDEHLKWFTTEFIILTVRTQLLSRFIIPTPNGKKKSKITNNLLENISGPPIAQAKIYSRRPSGEDSPRQKTMHDRVVAAAVITKQALEQEAALRQSDIGIERPNKLRPNSNQWNRHERDIKTITHQCQKLLPAFLHTQLQKKP